MIKGILIGLLVLAPVLAAAETVIDPPEASAEYARGKRLLREGDWIGAAAVFETLAGQYPDSPDMPLFVFQKAKANYYGSEFSKAVAGFSFFLSRYPQAPEIPYVHFFLANSFYRNGEVDRALRQYIFAYAKSNDQQLTRIARDAIGALFQNAASISVSASDFENVPPDRRCDLIKQIAPSLIDHGQPDLADNLLSGCGQAVTPGTEVTPVRSGGLEVAVMLPLSGDLQDFGQQIYNGAVIAADQYRAETGGRLSLVPYDTKGDPIDAARIVSEVSSSSATAAIGPLTSDEAAVSSARLHDTGLPLLVPAATEAGFTRLSETSFQLSPNIELQGVRMAEYAVRILNAHAAAVIAPTTTDQLKMAQAFIDRFEQLGGKIIATEYYRSRDKDFGPYIRDIKALVHGAIPDSIYYIDQRGDTIDIDGISASVDCLFLPGRSEQIRLLLPQINFYNLRGQYLGTDGWGDKDIYRLGDDVTKRAIFPSPFLPTRPTDEALQFASEYDTRYGSPPERLARLGYDAVRLIARASRTGSTDRDNLVSLLKGIEHYAGVSGQISFGPNRENIDLPLYRIESGAAVPLNPSPAPSSTPAPEPQD